MEPTPFKMPIVICKVGSGVVAVAAIGLIVAIVGGGIATAIYLEQVGGPYSTLVSWISSVLGGGGLCVFVAVIWWAMRQEFYAHCLRFWHPEMAPPKQVACPRCRTCDTCHGARWVEDKP